MFSRFIHIVVCIRITFLRLNNIPLIPPFVYLFICQWILGCCHLLATVTCYEQWCTSLQDSAFNSLGYIPRSGIAGSYSKSILVSGGIIIFYSSCTHFTFPPIVHSQFSSVAQSCPTLCDPMNHSTPGLPVHHQLSEFT